MLSNGGQDHIDQMLKKSSGEQWLPLNLSRSDITALPAKPGVYYFHDKAGKIIYVGKAINIRKRVTSHFTHNDPDRKRQLLHRNIYNISHRTCATELEALVLESTEIKRLWPRYNKSQKQPARRFGLYKFEDNRGYQRLAIDTRKKNLPVLYQFNLLNEGLVMLKKMITEFELNEKLCFIDKTPFTPAEFRKLEPPAVYNEKVKRALEELETRLPTFAVIDKGKHEKERLCLLIERGAFWGMGYLPTGQANKNIHEIKQHLQPYADNDYIRNSIYQFVEMNPEKKVAFMP